MLTVVGTVVWCIMPELSLQEGGINGPDAESVGGAAISELLSGVCPQP